MVFLLPLCPLLASVSPLPAPGQALLLAPPAVPGPHGSLRMVGPPEAGLGGAVPPVSAGPLPPEARPTPSWASGLPSHGPFSGTPVL